MSNKNLKKSRSGSGYMIIIAFAAILLIFFSIIGRVKSGQHHLQSIAVRRYVASTLGETALNCIIAELNANRAFNTHRSYNERYDDPWEQPYSHKDSYLGKMGDIFVEGVNKGIYSGGSADGEFKAKFALVHSARGNAKTKTLDEAQMYTRVEVAVKVGTGDAKNTTCRKVKALLERRFPAAEHLLYDGEILDLGGYGPFLGSQNLFQIGRLYGYHWLTFNTAGGADKGSEFRKMEKIETPGLIRAFVESKIGFRDGSSIRLSKQNDSYKISKFDTKDGLILDGIHGGRPIKFGRIPRERLKEVVDRYSKSQGVLIEKNTLPFGDFKNPYKASTQYVDLDFGDFKCQQKPKPKPKPKPDSRDDDDELDSAASQPPPPASDDPEIIKKKKGSKIIVFATVPLRIWGCPDRSITIYSTEEIVIGGDFNQSQKFVQAYDDDYFNNYIKDPDNGWGRYKVGALVMSDKRIILDMSHPTMYVKNEMRPYFMLGLIISLNPVDELFDEFKNDLCPLNPDTWKGVVGTDGTPRLGTVHFLKTMKEVTSGPLFESKVEDLKNFFTPGLSTVEKPRFAIQNEKIRKELINEVISISRETGGLTRPQLENIFEKAWAQAMKEENEAPAKNLGAMGMMQSLFEEAKKSHRDGLFIPEMTVNANLVSSSRRSAKWTMGNSNQKYPDEIGVPGRLEFLKSPAFVIQRVYGSEIRLATKEPDYFITGSYSCRNVLRRRVWDPTNIRGDYKVDEMPITYNLLTFSEEKISLREYDKFQ